MECPRCGHTRVLAYGSQGWIRCLQCQVNFRAGAPEDFQKEQGHGYHGYFEPGKGATAPPAGGGGGAGAPTEEGPPPPDLSDTAWSTAGKPLKALDWSKVVTQNPDGFTVNAKDGTSPTEGYQVSGKGEALHLGSDPIAAGKAIAKFAKAHPDNPIGGWLDHDAQGQPDYIIEESETITDKYQAALAGVERNQKSIWSNTEGKEYTTYGTGVYGEKNSNFNAPTLADGIHPGEKNSTVELKKGVFAPENFGASTMSGLSKGTQDKIKARAKEYGVTLAKATSYYAKALENASMQQIIDGLTAYPRYNAEAERAASQAGVSAEVAAGAFALFSRQTGLGSDVAGMYYMTKAIKDDKVIDIDDSLIEAASTAHDKGGKDISVQILNHVPLSQVGDIGAQARALMFQMSKDGILVDPQYGMKKDGGQSKVQLSCGDNGVESAIQLVRGRSANDTVNGMKQRSFYSNIADPNDPRYVTMDGFMFGIGMGAQQGTAYTQSASKQGKALLTVGPGAAQAQQIDNVSSCYPLMADALRAAIQQVEKAHKIYMVPNAGQAIAWYGAGGGVVKGTPGVNATIVRPDDTAFNPTGDDKPPPEPPTPAGEGASGGGIGGATRLNPPVTEGRNLDSEKDADKIMQKGPDPSGPLGGIGPLLLQGNGQFSEDSAVAAKQDVAHRLAANTESTIPTQELLETVGLILPGEEPFVPKEKGVMWPNPEQYEKGLREKATGEFVKLWAKTSNDSDPLSLATQESAIKEFGLSGTAEWGKRYTEPDIMSPTIQDAAKNVQDDHGPAIQALLRSQYNDTQKLFAESGIKSVTLYRGQTKGPPGVDMDALHTSDTASLTADSVSMRPMSSWTTDYGTAEGFTGRGHNAVIMSADVPVHQILSTPRTGFGCLNEKEMVVLGNVNGVTIDEHEPEY